MARLIRNRHGKRFSQVKMIEDGKLSTSHTYGNAETARFGFSIYWHGKDNQSDRESFEIDMNRAEAEANAKSLAMSLGYKLVKE